MDSPLLRNIVLIAAIFGLTVLVGSVFGAASMIVFLILVKIAAIVIDGMREGYRQTMAEKRKHELVTEDGTRLEVIEDPQALYSMIAGDYREQGALP